MIVFERGASNGRFDSNNLCAMRVHYVQLQRAD